MHRSVALAAGLLLPALAFAAPTPQIPIEGSKIPRFAQPLPLLSVQAGGVIKTLVTNNTSFTAPLEIRMCEFKAHVLPPGTFAAGATPETWVWGYIPGTLCPTTVQETYLGPVLVNIRNIATTIRYTNALPTVAGTNVLAYKYSTDQTLHWADPLGAGGNECHMTSGDPPQVGVGIPAYHSECSQNFGEWFDSSTNTGGFTPVGIPAVPHLHGGEVPPVLDGGPNAWFTSDGLMKGHDYYTNPKVPAASNQAVYSYPNTQGAAPLWFHDHTLGATRLNVYAGLAGGYYILDPVQDAYSRQIQMRPVTEVIPIILQDRMFDTNGQLYFPSSAPGGINGPPTNPEHPYWIPEFIGDSIVVNGKVWPFLDVEPRRYRFLFINGSNARSYSMFFANAATTAMGPAMWAIGNDDGFLDKPSIMDPNAARPIETQFIMMPGERYEVVVDFSKFAGQTLLLKNVANAPFPSGTPPLETSTGQLMQFRVSATPVADTSYDPASGIALRPSPIVRLTNPATGRIAADVTVSTTRELTLNEMALAAQTAIDPVTGLTTTYPGGPVEILINNSLWAGKNRPDFKPVTINNITEYVSEFPKEGAIELWEIVNTTMDAHPIHTHLASFQILNRQNYDTSKFMEAYQAAFPGDGTTACPKGVYCAGFGPPNNYEPVTKNAGGKWGGNPDITRFLRGALQVPGLHEGGWKDTFITYPGMVNRFLVRWGPQETPKAKVAGYPFSPNDSPGGSVNDSHGYVWHCHIIDHEDNEMMRPDVIDPIPGAPRSVIKGVDY